MISIQQCERLARSDTKAAYSILGCGFVYSSILKMQVTCLSETSVDFQRASRHCTAEHRALLLNVIRYHNIEELERLSKS